jgi:hypothetical protein
MARIVGRARRRFVARGVSAAFSSRLPHVSERRSDDAAPDEAGDTAGTATAFGVGMDGPDPASGAVLVVRLWAEPSAPEGFLARVTGSVALDADVEQLAVAASEDEVLAAVRAWLAEARSGRSNGVEG